MKNKLNIDLKLMLRTADEFLTISSNKETFITNAVNAAFACEIYLKFLLYSKFKCYPNEHDLRKLYNEAVSQNALDEQAFLKILSDEIADSMSSESLKNDTSNAISMLNTMLDGVKDHNLEDGFILYPHKNISVEWRYIFEEKIPYEGIIDSALYRFAEALKRYVDSTAS